MARCFITGTTPSRSAQGSSLHSKPDQSVAGGVLVEKWNATSEVGKAVEGGIAPEAIS